MIGSHFHDFWSQIGVVILVTPKTGNGAKKRVVLRRNIFCSKFKVEWENGVRTKIRFLASGFFLFICGNFTLIFTVFSIFGSNFFLSGFPNPFIVRSRSIFLVNENSWNCTSGLVLLFFNSSSPSMILTTWLLGIDFSDFYCFAVKILCVKSFLLLDQLRDLPHSKKMITELTYGTL